MNNLPQLSPCPNCRYVNQPEYKLSFYGFRKGYKFKTDINCRRCGTYFDGGTLEHWNANKIPVGTNLQGCFIVLVVKLFVAFVLLFVVLAILFAVGGK